MCAIYICFIVLFSVRIKFFNHFLNFLRYNVVLLGLYMYGLKDWNMFELLNFSLFKLCSIEKLINYIYIYIYILFAVILKQNIGIYQYRNIPFQWINQNGHQNGIDNFAPHSLTLRDDR
jgi:hypothetical protein